MGLKFASQLPCYHDGAVTAQIATPSDGRSAATDRYRWGVLGIEMPHQQFTPSVTAVHDLNCPGSTQSLRPSDVAFLARADAAAGGAVYLPAAARPISEQLAGPPNRCAVGEISIK